MTVNVDANKQIKLLTDAEYQQIYDIPEFTQIEQEWFFELTQEEQALLNTGATKETKIDAILQLGYFKAKQRFFNFQLSEVKLDCDYIRHRYFKSVSITKDTISRKSKHNNQQRILELFKYQRYSGDTHQSQLIEKACYAARLSSNPSFIFQELVNWFDQNKIIIAGYTTLQEIVSKAIYSEQGRISQILNQYLTTEERKYLFDLLEQKDNHYELTILKRDPKNFKPKAIYKEVTQFMANKARFDMAKRVLPKLEISKNSIDYFSSLVEHFTIQGLSRTNIQQTCLWLLCFIYLRYRKMLDNLTTMFVYIANNFESDVENEAHDLLVAESVKEVEKKTSIAKLIRLYIDENLDRKQPFNNIVKKAYAILAPEIIERIASQYEDKKFHEKFTWQAVDKLSRTYIPLLRALLQVLPLESDKHLSLQKTINFIKANLEDGKTLTTIPYEDFPKKVISNSVKKHVLDDEEKHIAVNRYEYYCYLKIAEYLSCHSLFVNDSTQYRSLQSELIPNWEKNKKTTLKKLNNKKLSQSIDQFIEEKIKPLDKKILEVNAAIESGENTAIKVKHAKDGGRIWTLPYTKNSFELNNPYYEQIPQVNISQVLNFVHQQIGFVNQFTHIKPHRAKDKRDAIAIFACIIANGTNLGVGKMAEISDISATDLNSANRNFIRLSTLRNANEVIGNAIAALPIFKHWNFVSDLLHASLDGQKFVTECDTLLARYSPKYFGLMKGVVAYTLLANHVPVDVKIIGANEHESRHLFDLVYNNTSDIHPDIFSTDTEGSNQLNFLLLYMIEKMFAPRYRSLRAKTESIISFSNPKVFKDCLIKPDKQVKIDRLYQEENNIQHILASLLLGETKQSNIISKLSMKEFRNQTKLALWDMNATLLSEYLLDYVSDIIIRQSVHGSLCRGEAYHQLRRHISLIHGRNFRGSSEKEISVWNECARLLANTSIYYNAMILTTLIEQHENQGLIEKANFIKGLSPVAWTHINFSGRYQLLVDACTINLKELLAGISENNHLISNVKGVSAI